MRILIVSLSFLFALNAHAVRVGDQVNYTGSMTVRAVSTLVKVSSKVTAFNSSTGKYTVETTQTVGAEVNSRTQELDAENIGDEDYANQIIANCSELGGSLEQVTVAGQSMQSCKMNQQDPESGANTTINVAPVPFMIVRYSSSNNGTLMSLELESFVRGQ